MQLTDLINRVRIELGDAAHPLRTAVQGDGVTTWYDLPTPRINQTGFEVTVNGSVLDSSHYTVDDTNGQLLLDAPLNDGDLMIVTGTSYSMFSDNELLTPLRDAVVWHTSGRTFTERRRTDAGFISYRDNPTTLSILPPEEELPIVILATINAQWTLLNDASLDVNVNTAEATNIDRGARYNQLMRQIGANQDRYDTLCGLLNIGPNRMETMELRRVSQTNGRLVPLFKPREYDDHRYPIRKLPPIDGRYEDPSGIPSQLFYGAGL